MRSADPNEILPSHTVTVGTGENVLDAAFGGPSADSLYILVQGPSVDIAAALAGVWPEILVGVLGLMVLIWVVLLLRVRRRPRAPGRMHCRRCNYDVTEQVKTEVASSRPVCPECGTDLKRKKPRPARSVLGRMEAATGAVLVVAMGYGALLVAEVPRDEWMPRGWSAWHPVVDRAAKRWDAEWLLRHQEDVTRVVRVDAATGRVRGTVVTKRGMMLGLSVTPDGEGLIAVHFPEYEDHDEERYLVWLDARSGRTRARIDDIPAMAGFEAGSGAPLLVTAGDAPHERRLVRWNRETELSDMQVVHTWNAPEVPEPDPAFFRLSGPVYFDDYKVVRLGSEDLLIAMEVGRAEMRVRCDSLTSGGAVRWEVPYQFRSQTAELTSSPDGTKVYLTAYDVTAIDVRTGEQREIATSKDGVTTEICPSADGKWLFAAVERPWIDMYDTTSWQRVARLKLSSGTDEIRVTKDGRWLAAMEFWTTTVNVFDLQAVQRAIDEGKFTERESGEKVKN